MRMQAVADEPREGDDGAIVEGAAMLMTEEPAEHIAARGSYELLKILTQVLAFRMFIRECRNWLVMR